jgi:hypothetical protein
MQTSGNFVRSLGERFCLAAWMILMIANTVMIGLSVELLVFGSILSAYNVTLIDRGTLPFLMIGFAAGLNFPVVVKLHTLGVTHLNFQTHENMLNNASESWQSLILALLDEKIGTSDQLEKFIRAINDAPSAAERQARRMEVKTWLIENSARLTAEDREIVLEHLSYLKIP